MDLNGARRKNATRETTSTLKAWLNEHKKNPYPTKGEKIMLAIITKMTLTQVSTWFANARRRLKKENKMTWEPRNRVEDEDNNNDDDDHKSTDGKDILGRLFYREAVSVVLKADLLQIQRIRVRLQAKMATDNRIRAWLRTRLANGVNLDQIAALTVQIATKDHHIRPFCRLGHQDRRRRSLLP